MQIVKKDGVWHFDMNKGREENTENSAPKMELLNPDSTWSRAEGRVAE